MAIAPLQPPPSWYRHFWYAKRSPRDTLLDRMLIFAVVALSLVVGGMIWIPRAATTHGTDHAAVADTRH